jgi:hypothetical protein
MLLLPAVAAEAVQQCNNPPGSPQGPGGALAAWTGDVTATVTDRRAGYTTAAIIAPQAAAAAAGAERAAGAEGAAVLRAHRYCPLAVVVVVVVVAVVRLAASLVWLLLLHQQGHVAVACLKEVEQVGHRGVVRLWHNRQRAAGRTRQVERGGISITLYVLTRNQQDTLLVESAVQSRKQHMDRPIAAAGTGTLTRADTGGLTAHG